MRLALLLLVGLVFSELLVRNMWRVGLSDFDLEMWRYANEVKVVSKNTAIGLEHRPNVESHLMGVNVRTDSFGFRRPDQELERTGGLEKPLIMVIGDSETLGWGVSEGETYSAQLERAMPRFRVLNGGIGNTNTSMQVNLLSSNLEKGLRPEWIIVGYSINDPEVTPELKRDFHFTQLAIGFLAKRLFWIFERRGSENYIRYYQNLYSEQNEGWLNWKAAVEELAKISQMFSIPVSALLLPEMHQPHRQGMFREQYDKVARYFALHRIEVIDPSDQFPPGDGSQFWVHKTDPHPNSLAHKIFARALSKSANAERLTSVR